MVPESAGGSGMSLLDGVVVYEELGRSLAPVPHFVSCVLSAAAISEAGTAAQQAELLGGIASGETIATVGWLEPGGGYKPRGVQLAARANGDGFVLDGSKEHVQFAAAADLIVVLARSGDRDTDIDLFVVEADALGTEPRSADVDLVGHPVPGNPRRRARSRRRPPGQRRRTPVGAGWEAWQRAMHAGAILAAAQAVGGASAALEMTVEYAKERRQFNKALAEFQAISHYLADARTALDGAQLLVYEAAWALSTGRSTEQLAPMAKLFACRTYREVTAVCQQVFGGIGFTVEYDIQLYFRRAKQLQLSWWDPATCEDRIADAVLGPA